PTVTWIPSTSRPPPRWPVTSWLGQGTDRHPVRSGVTLATGGAASMSYGETGGWHGSRVVASRAHSWEHFPQRRTEHDLRWRPTRTSGERCTATWAPEHLCSGTRTGRTHRTPFRWTCTRGEWPRVRAWKR